MQLWILQGTLYFSRLSLNIFFLNKAKDSLRLDSRVRAFQTLGNTSVGNKIHFYNLGYTNSWFIPYILYTNVVYVRLCVCLSFFQSIYIRILKSPIFGFSHYFNLFIFISLVFFVMWADPIYQYVYKDKDDQRAVGV